MSPVEYLEDISWFQDLPDGIANLKEAQRFEFRKNQLVMTRHGISSWAFLLRGEVDWMCFDPQVSRVRPFGRVAPGQFMGRQDMPTGSIAVAATEGELLLMPRPAGQPEPIGRMRHLAGRLRIPANDLPFHACHLDALAPLGPAVDVGSSAGSFTQLLAGYSDAVTALDPSGGAASLATQRMYSLGYKNFAFVQACAESMPFEARSLDLIGCRLAIHQFQDPAAFAAEARRALRVGGVLALSDLVALDDPDTDRLLNVIERTRDPTHGLVMSKQELLDIFGPGFEVRATLNTVFRIQLMPWLRQGDVAPEDLLRLKHEIAGCSDATRQRLGLSTDLETPRAAFDSPRFSVILRRTS